MFISEKVFEYMKKRDERHSIYARIYFTAYDPNQIIFVFRNDDEDIASLLVKIE